MVYAQVISFHFVNLDDPLLVYDNSFVTVFSPAHLAHSFFTYDPELYIPLTFVSYQVETAVAGLNAWHFHLINLLLHLGCVTLVFLVLRRLLDARIALLTAALFALHPINTETVAWISARKDLLSALFSLASLYAFLSYRHTPRRKWRIATILFFALALLGKATAITLPAIFLLIDVWQKRSIANRKMATDYAPLALLSAVFGVIALVGKRKAIAHAVLTPLSWVLLSMKAVVMTIAHVVWPLHLSPFYPVSGDISFLHAQYAVPVLLVIATMICLALWRLRSLSIALSMFLVALLPSFFTFAKDDHLYLTSDRYAYLPSIMLFVLIATGVSRLMHRRNVAVFALIPSFVLASSYGAISILQAQIWRNSVALNQAILAQSPDEYHSINNLGNALETEGKTDEALALYKRAVAINPQFEYAYLNAGSLLANQKKYPAAIALFAAGLQKIPRSIALQENMGLAQEDAGQSDAAIATYESILALDPRDILALQEVASLYGKKKEFEKALAAYKQLMDIDPAFKTRVLEQMKQSGMGK